MLSAARIYFIVFALLTIVGGLIGYLKAGSVISLVAGGVCGALLLVAAWLLPGNLPVGLGLGLLVSLALAGQFVPKFISTGKAMPAGMMSVVSVIGAVFAVAAWLKK